MPVKIKGLKKLNKKYKGMLPDARSVFAKEMKKNIVQIILEKIVKGLSPVKGQNKYPDYSDEYAKKKGGKAPVDLYASGEMLESMFAKQTNKDTIIVEFKGARNKKLASIHNRKNGKMPQRKILPKGNEDFKADIMKQITAIYRKALIKVTK